jgi:ethanolamine transporter EutH
MHCGTGFRRLRQLFDLNAHMTAGNFLWRAVLISVPLTALAVALVKGLLGWALVSGIATALSTANGLWPLRPALETLDWADEIGIVLFAIIALFAPALMLICSPFVLIWTLVRAYKLAMRPTRA